MQFFSLPSELYGPEHFYRQARLDSCLFSLELLKLSLILLAEMGLGAMLPDTLCRNELTRVKCVAPSLQIMAPWPRQGSERRRAIEISILWPRWLVTADTLTGPLALQSQATVTSPGADNESN